MLAALLPALLPLVASQTDAPATTPNVVVILCDDLGYGDVSPLNDRSRIPTPAFAQLAREGMTFTDAHTSAAVCTPTRYALLTGRHCWRTRLKSGVLGGYSRPLIEPDRETLARMLQRAGYRTHCVGKWHLGLGWQTKEEINDIDNFGRPDGIGKVDYTQPIEGGPLSVGFDSCFLVAASLDMSPYTYVRNDRVTALPTTMIDASPFPAFYRRGEKAEDFDIEGTLDRLVEVASGVIREARNDEQPFFLYMPLTSPHKPVLPAERFRGRTDLGPYGDFIVQTDDAVGRILNVLEQNGTADDTLVIVTSDNGSYMRRTENTPDHTQQPSQQAFLPSHHTANGPWRGTKADIYEAGHRVPFFVRWPGLVEAGSQSNATVCQTDLIATLSEVVGESFDRDSAEDSFSMIAALNQNDVNRRGLVSQSASGMLAIREGQLKLIVGSGSGGRERPRGRAFETPYQLYDLAADPGEQKNLAATRPDDVARLEARLLEITHGDELRPKPTKTPDRAKSRQKAKRPNAGKPAESTAN